MDSLRLELQGALLGFLPELDVAVRKWMSSRRVPEADRLETYRLEFGRLLQATIGRLTTHHCNKRFGEETAAMLTVGTRNSLARIFSSRQNVEAIMRGNRSENGSG